MQTVLTYLTFLITGMLLQAQNTLEVKLTHLDSDTGTLVVGLYNEEGQFLNKTYKAISTKIKNQEATVMFKGVPPGLYAISSYHDKDDDGKLNMLMGIMPSEPYACSYGS